MNIHHLELFYYVARHGGILPAVRNMPYGIQQPAVSGQIARLEESLGTKLFNRRPFALLPAGKELFEFIRPFFDEIDRVGEAIRGGSAHSLRVAAPAIVLQDYLPEIFQRVRKHFPSFRLSLHEAARAEAERLWPVSADRPLRLRPGFRGGLGTPVKAVLRKLMRWYVEPLAYDQRSFNAAALRLVDDLENRVAALEAELARLRAADPSR